jgi:hypothetical protein
MEPDMPDVRFFCRIDRPLPGDRYEFHIYQVLTASAISLYPWDF